MPGGQRCDLTRLGSTEDWFTAGDDNFREILSKKTWACDGKKKLHVKIGKRGKGGSSVSWSKYVKWRGKVQQIWSFCSKYKRHDEHSQFCGFERHLENDKGPVDYTSFKSKAEIYTITIKLAQNIKKEEREKLVGYVSQEIEYK